MSLWRLILANLAYHWRGNAAVGLGVAVAATVLAGALLVGDALRGSLRALALKRLGWIDQALLSNRFLREQTVRNLPAEKLAPALVIQATAELDDGRPVRHIQLVGVDAHFWPDGRYPDQTEASFWAGTAEEVVINEALAQAAEVKPGQELSLRVQKPSEVPPEIPLARQELQGLPLTVRAVLPAGAFGTAFEVQPGLDTPRNAFVPLHTLQRLLNQPGRVNAVFAAGTAELTTQLGERLTLDDWGLMLLTPWRRAERLIARLDRDSDGKLTGSEWYRRVSNRRIPRFAALIAEGIVHKDPIVLTREEIEAYYRQHHPYLSLESRQLLLEPFLAQAAEAVAQAEGLHRAPTLVYLANRIQEGDKSIPYSVVAALDPNLPPPLGPFVPPGANQVRDGKIVLVDWKGSPLPFRENATITLTYFPPEQHGDFQEETATFSLAGSGPLPLTGAAADPDLTPEFPGLTDKMDIRSWDPPFLFDRSRIKPGDVNEQFWEEFRTTPKAYITLRDGKRLWGSRYGNLTSIRLSPSSGQDLEESARDFEKKLLQQLTPKSGGLVFQPVKADALRASTGGTDFGGLFLAFSFFLIAAALLLVSLLYRLNFDRRAGEVGLLLAAGYSRRTVAWLLLAEGVLIAALGALIGCGLAQGYAALLVRLLAALWPGQALQSFLRPHFDRAGVSLLIGFGGALLTAGLTIAWTLRGLVRISPSALLAGVTSLEREPGVVGRPRRSWWIAALSLIGAVAALAMVPYVQGHEAKAGTFFCSGGLLLTAALAALSGWLRSGRHRSVEGSGWGTIARLGVRNAARNPLRSLLTAGLLAAAAFLIVAVESFRRQAEGSSGGIHSPSGGFNLLAESDLPIYTDLNSDRGRRQIEERLLVAYGQDEARTRQAMQLLREVTIIALRSRAGDDASCLNLYQPRRPRVLGVPDALIQRGGFQFAEVLQPDPEMLVDNPWQILQQRSEVVPAFGEKNTVEWMLKSHLDGEVGAPAGHGAEQPLRIVGLLQDSVFQSSLLIWEEAFLRLYPQQEGYKYFLIQAPAGREAEVQRVLEAGLANRGFAVTRTADRLNAYLAVENTYLSTFQALGGLGLLLGSLGLAVVLLRSVWERRAELALFRALGYRRLMLGWMVLAENGFLLLAGLAAGTLAALAAVVPHVLAGGGSIPWLHLAALLIIVPLVGLGAAGLAVASTLRAPLVPALRRE
jgi:ABC-type antimicrobial peptide transport system permease subunit